MALVPQLPTDNLYKFMAIGGLVLIVLAFYTQYTDLLQARVRQEQIDMRLSLLEVDEARVTFSANRALQEKHPSPEEVRRLTARSGSLSRELAAIRSQARANDREYTHGPSIYFGPLLMMGGGTVFFGFLLWYLNLQRPQDELLRRAVEKERAAAPE